MKCFVINNMAVRVPFQNHDSGVDMALRALLSRKARSGTQDQVVTSVQQLGGFHGQRQADAYDRNIRWLANRPWSPLVALEQIARRRGGRVGRRGGRHLGYAVARGSAGADQAGPQLAEPRHARELRQLVRRLADRGRPRGQGVRDPARHERAERYGMLYTTGIVTDAWDAVSNRSPTPTWPWLARERAARVGVPDGVPRRGQQRPAALQHGDYMKPATSYQRAGRLCEERAVADAHGGRLWRVDDWAAHGAAGDTTTPVTAEDVDLDGEDEYLLYNDRLFAVFERIGGRMVGCLGARHSGRAASSRRSAICGLRRIRDGGGGAPTTSTTNGTVVAYRTSGLKDWWVEQAVGTLSTSTISTRSSAGERLADDVLRLRDPQDGHAGRPAAGVRGGVPAVGRFRTTLYVRTGLSPNLQDLLVRGQRTLAASDGRRRR